ncbi:hypothetical protein G6F57_014294 [Rhizopus arrhizus]|uniref:Uncharacterized protein n=1 Tax=Rhizopus oryzae TaxID=64495 RepID=A0A9P6WZ71_RHIOR|nr:hypothetical protein G6F30_012908 [Rhizopus arrhizus]KAG0972996.1 hypothetical protein G6F29_013121 [Rhizopus arrhizus]KAG0974893.1 hypothetical protein G6F28_013090 [Rhizopus arrhizus]KAG1001166.1 hypothetical protein G6F27_013128 [Rhizopus arrhizus]KAG1015969.1 hypothetical protein G6F26_012877 [Rhizopus arrhizus]
MIKNIEEMVIEYSRTPSNAMSNIKKGRKKNKIIKMTNIDEYISTVMPCPDSENEDKSEDEDPDDENQDDQEDEEQEAGRTR